MHIFSKFKTDGQRTRASGRDKIDRQKESERQRQTDRQTDRDEEADRREVGESFISQDSADKRLVIVPHTSTRFVVVVFCLFLCLSFLLVWQTKAAQKLLPRFKIEQQSALC